MGREVRKVPGDWVHPRDGRGALIPLHDGEVDKDQREWDAGLALWCRGLRDDGDGGQEAHGDRRDIYGWVEWTWRRPAAEDYMPAWPAEARTHLMMYETTSEGTPISPAFATAENLARWLAGSHASAFGNQTATYDQWLRTIQAGGAVSAVFTRESGLISGVADLGNDKGGT